MAGLVAALADLRATLASPRAPAPPARAPGAMADALDECVEFMNARARRLAGYTRLHAPTVAEPFRVVSSTNSPP